MRNLLIAAIAALPLVVFAGPPTTVTLAVQNMTCPLCPFTVSQSLKKMSGVNAVQVDFDQKTATIIYDPEIASPEALINATTNAGYPSVVQE